MAGDRPKRETKPVEKFMPPEPAESKPRLKKAKAPKVKATKPAKKAKTEKPKGEKKPVVGYMLFCKHNREAAKKKVPAGTETKSLMPAVAKILGEMWAKQSDANKAAWKAGKVPK